MRHKRVYGAFIAAALTFCLAVMPVSATPSDSVQSLQDEQTDLENQKSNAQSELNSLKAQLETILTKTAELEDQLIAKGQEISQAEDDLADAEDRRQEQYDAMKLRIKYVYESGGDAAALEKILSSGDITGMLTQAEYSQKVHEYDREQLQAYAETVQEIADLQTTLETEMANLEQLEADYQSQEEELNSMIASKQNEISNFDDILRQMAAEILERQQAQAAEEDDADDDGAADNGGTEDTGNTGGNGGTGGNNGNTGNTGSQNTPSYDASTGNSAVARAQSKLGCAYEYGAAGPDTFDCSGLVSYALTGSYVHVYNTYSLMALPRVSDPQPGDVCTSYTHCGIYIGGGMMIHAPQTGDVVKVSAVHSGMVYVRP